MVVEDVKGLFEGIPFHDETLSATLRREKCGVSPLWRNETFVIEVFNRLRTSVTKLSSLGA